MSIKEDKRRFSVCIASGDNRYYKHMDDKKIKGIRKRMNNLTNFNRLLLTVLLITIIITLVNTNILINNTNIMIKNNMEKKEGMKIGVNYKLPALKEIN